MGREGLLRATSSGERVWLQIFEDVFGGQGGGEDFEYQHARAIGFWGSSHHSGREAEEVEAEYEWSVGC